jgi:ATP-dependent exoDNAse (exonuclease V) beta subunit
MTGQLDDALQRRRALEPGSSFIVQAPAGSGKTELLVQRYLALLARVRRPEEILAITFTRKAASEMRDRVVRAMDRSRRQAEPEAEPERTAWRLAKEVSDRDRQLEWSLLETPNRLRIQTIDALAASLTRQMPLLSGFGSQPAIVEDSEELYRRAAERTVTELESRSSWSASLEVLFKHLDNDLDKVAGLITDMLGRRDQWLRHVADARSDRLQRTVLEQALQRVIAERLDDLRHGISERTAGDILSLARFAASNLDQESQSPLLCCSELTELPGPDPEDLPRWLGLAELLLTREGTLRKRVNKNLGFPPPKGGTTPEERELFARMKETHAEAVARLGEDGPLREALHALRGLPAAAYGDRQWGMLRALFEVLPLAVAHLHLEFESRGAVDFIEISLRSLQALGAPQEPTDLALLLDYRLQHILVDEFQDTSLTQFALLERLTEGWQPGDGRTLFAVGDPMQSIYRFREAEVGLFLRARRCGLGQVLLEPLRLSANFRSRSDLVQRINAIGPRIFPDREDETAGAVAFRPSAPVRPDRESPTVLVHPFFERDDEAESRLVVDIIRRQRDARPEERIAVLVRSRSHLSHIVAGLRSAGLPFQAVDIEPLGDRPVIRDLLSLSKALSHRADRLSWLALLRAPWCGLTLNDLHCLANAVPEEDIPSLLTGRELPGCLSQDGTARLRRIVPIFAQALRERQRQPFSRLVEGVWLALGGPACLQEEQDLDNARVFFSLLDRSAGRSGIAGFERFQEEVQALFAAPQAEADGRLQVMTIHKAKGLEFDTVILPGLGRKPQSDRKPLLLWQERTARDGSRDLLLAPMAESGRADDSIYRYIRDLNADKQAFENIRLSYVAMTRAREQLHLIGHTTLRSDGSTMNRPAAGSLLAYLWPALEPEFSQRLADGPPSGQEDDTASQEALEPPRLQRLAPAWSLPDPPPGISRTGRQESVPDEEYTSEELRFDWAGETVRRIGTVVHSYLQRICRTGVHHWDAGRLAEERPDIEHRLLRFGLDGQTIPEAAAEVEQAVLNSLTDQRGRWILQEHPLARSELALSGELGGRVINVVLDRTFVDDQGIRWIIDYKAGVHFGGDPEEFLDREMERYRPQLETYAALLRKMDSRPIWLGLYFPRQQGWRAWPWPG